MTTGSIVITVPMEELERLQTEFPRAVGSALHRARKALERSLLEVVPFRTGRLFESMKIWEGASGLTITFDPVDPYTGEHYGRIVEMGAPPHEIEAGAGKTLHFWKDGQEIFRKRVLHTGYSGRGFLPKVKQMIINTVREELEIALIALSMR